VASSRRQIAETTAAALLLLSLAGSAIAGPGFIEASRVRSGDLFTEITVRFKCNVNYLEHSPRSKGDQLVLHLEPTTICQGVSPSIADTREQIRPPAADKAKLVSIEYDGSVQSDKLLHFMFEESVQFFVSPTTNSNTVTVRVFADRDPDAADAETNSPARGTRQVQRDAKPASRYVINLASMQRRPAASDLPAIKPPTGRQLVITEATINGELWYRVRIGYYDAAQQAASDLATYRESYPRAWIDRADAVDAVTVDIPSTTEEDTAGPETDQEVAQLMRDANRAMTAGEISRAVQIYTKVLRMPASDYHQDAQEFLALARERNGQVAHAKAEYERYLALYPDADGADRVRQRLAALLSTGSSPKQRTASASSTTSSGGAPWKIRTFFSQYYRRHVNQVTEGEEITSQSSLYSDLSIDARKRGERFDLSARLTAGYRNSFMEETTSSGNNTRVSYAYVDLADAGTRLRGRLGRQTRNTGGVLGRFDGLNLSWDLGKQVRLQTVAGVPVYSTSYDDDVSRSFTGLSANFVTGDDNLDIGVFALQQDVEGMTDRQGIGAELRYFGESFNVWSIADYDPSFGELGSVFAQGSWRISPKSTISGVIDRRYSPFLSLGNAVIGQPLIDFDQLQVTMTEDEIRQLANDRSALSTTVSLGLSQALSPRFQLNLNASETRVDETTASQGVAATPATTYRYVSTNLVASSLFKEGDTAIVGLRYSSSDSTDVYSLSLDTRLPAFRNLRVSPRLRVDYREIRADQSTQWLLTPGLRVQYRWGRKTRLDLEAGRQFSRHEMAGTDIDRDSYFINLGYQLFF